MAEPDRKPAFEVETIHLDLAPLAGSFGQRHLADEEGIAPSRFALATACSHIVTCVNRPRAPAIARNPRE